MTTDFPYDFQPVIKAIQQWRKDAHAQAEMVRNYQAPARHYVNTIMRCGDELAAHFEGLMYVLVELTADP